jgi:outer membrane scaffolding protein for murein synthesis (MipA/OmpV family)
MKQIAKSMTLTLCLIGTSITVFASDAVGPGESDSTWIVGTGAVRYNNIYAGENRESNGFINFTYNGDTFFVKDGTLNLHLYDFDKFSFGLTANGDNNFLSDRTELENNDMLRGVIERDNTVEAGFYLYHTTKTGRLKFRLLTDIADKHNGETASLSYTFALKAGDWHINPSIGMNWNSADKVNHHFGVSEMEANPSRAVYSGSSALNYHLGISARYEITDHIDIKLNTGVNFLDSSIKNSSIVEDDKGYFGGVSFNYNF